MNKSNSLFNTYLSETRDEHIQKDSFRFRRNMERMGSIIAYEISKQMEFSVHEVPTPFGIAEEHIIAQPPVIISVLRAGVPVHQGVLNFFDSASGGFISMHRDHDKDGNFQVSLEYISCPSINNREVILCDAMIASGASMSLAYQSLLRQGAPKHVYLIALIASREGLENLRKKLPSKGVSLWFGALDDELTAKSYIVPGLGDAGDLAFGAKDAE
ncbi:MAG: uracil phosphoribosyltransferase [Bacteroidales bacterium]|jgi:uracil phosphoribosyltransferase|nr:uracil phosphoribosyltransferase [Bacteroidales bacterium]